MKTTTDEPEKLVRTIRSGYLGPFGPSAVCFLAAGGFAATHYLLYAVGFLFSGVIYLPIAVSQYRRNKRISEKAIRNYLKWIKEHPANPCD